MDALFSVVGSGTFVKNTVSPLEELIIVSDKTLPLVVDIGQFLHKLNRGSSIRLVAVVVAFGYTRG